MMSAEATETHSSIHNISFPCDKLLEMTACPRFVLFSRCKNTDVALDTRTGQYGENKKIMIFWTRYFNIDIETLLSG